MDSIAANAQFDNGVILQILPGGGGGNLQGGSARVSRQSFPNNATTLKYEKCCVLWGNSCSVCPALLNSVQLRFETLSLYESRQFRETVPLRGKTVSGDCPFTRPDSFGRLSFYEASRFQETVPLRGQSVSGDCPFTRPDSFRRLSLYEARQMAFSFLI